MARITYKHLARARQYIYMYLTSTIVVHFLKTHGCELGGHLVLVETIIYLYSKSFFFKHIRHKQIRNRTYSGQSAWVLIVGMYRSYRNFQKQLTNPDGFILCVLAIQ